MSAIRPSFLDSDVLICILHSSEYSMLPSHRNTDVTLFLWTQAASSDSTKVAHH